MANKTTFREKNINKINSPESLSDYIKVANPSVWITLCAIVLLLVGLCIWAATATVYFNENIIVVSKDGKCTGYIYEDDIEMIGAENIITIDGTPYEVGEIPATPVCLDDNGEEAYAVHLLKSIRDEQEIWVYKVPVIASLPEGAYQGIIAKKAIKPIKYVTN